MGLQYQGLTAFSCVAITNNNADANRHYKKHICI